MGLRSRVQAVELASLWYALGVGCVPSAAGPGHPELVWDSQEARNETSCMVHGVCNSNPHMPTSNRGTLSNT